MLDLKDIFTFLLLITFSCAISAVDSKSPLISSQIKHNHKNLKLPIPFKPEK